MSYIQVTVSGKDYNGFAWQNVFYLDSERPSGTIAAHLAHTNDFVYDTIMDDLMASMSSQCVALDIGSRYVNPDSSYTVHKPISRAGQRDLNQNTGAAAGVVKWFTTTGPETGRQYFTGVCEDDFQNDFIVGAYLALLEAVRDAFLELTGTSGIYSWIFVVYSKGAPNATPPVPPSIDKIILGEVQGKIGILSKRVRN